MSILSKLFATVTAVTIVPFTLSIVRPISKIGSIARIPPARGKYAPIHIPEITTDTAIVAVPGRPAIPRELTIIITRSIP